MSLAEIVFAVVVILALLRIINELKFIEKASIRIPVQIKQPFESFERTDFCGNYIRAVKGQFDNPDFCSLKTAQMEVNEELNANPIIGGFIDGWEQPVKSVIVTRRKLASEPHYIIYLETKRYPYRRFEEMIVEGDYEVVRVNLNDDSEEAKNWIKNNC